MKFIPYRFTDAGTAGHVFLITSNGGVKSLGIGASPVIWPVTGTIVAVVPTGQESVSFGMVALTKSNLAVKVDVLFSVRLNPEKALNQFDFSTSGANNWKESVQARATEYCSQATRDVANKYELNQAIISHGEFKAAIEAALQSKFDDASGVEVVSVEVSGVTAVERVVEEALGAVSREAILTNRATAVHNRQMKAQEEKTVLATQEIEDRNHLAEAEVEVIESENANELARAQGTAKAERVRVAVYKNIDNGKIAAMALQQMAEQGVGTLNITDGILAAITASVNKS